MQEPELTTRNGYYIGKVLDEPRRDKRTFEVDEGDRAELMALFGRLVGESMEKDADAYRSALLVRVTHGSPQIEQEIARLETKVRDEKHEGYRQEQIEQIKENQLHVGQCLLITDALRLPGGDGVAFRTDAVIAVLRKDD